MTAMKYFCLMLARQTDREEIRRRLAMGTDEEYYGGERTFKKPSLSARLQGGMNLQICFVNDAAASSEDGDITPTAAPSSIPVMASTSQSYHNLSAVSPAAGPKVKGPTPRCTDTRTSKNRPLSDPGILAAQLSLPPSAQEHESLLERQQRLQQEARIALAQASNMARMQLEVERQTKKKSPIADIVGLPELADGRTIKLSRKVLLEMNLAQLQVLVNDLHTQIESLNEVTY
ncbi:schwannomin-interacting protein 1-like isoform X2 [Pomacea canaliculata]|uniref:schwannomin-interacting protein 1-like isoform X2 n=1 Tax=Pomacea canaliculata TaxID=400727 RepID=UPI000D7399AD|nr:schwannomin-interacting protein 1-like isoform X2 [Pomacea canaliculata]